MEAGERLLHFSVRNTSGNKQLHVLAFYFSCSCGFFKLASHRMTCHVSSQNIALYAQGYSLLPCGSFCLVTQKENRKGSDGF